MLIIIALAICYAATIACLVLVYYFADLRPAAKQAKKLLESQSQIIKNYKIYAPF